MVTLCDTAHTIFPLAYRGPHTHMDITVCHSQGAGG